MRVDLTAREFVALAQRMDELNGAVGAQRALELLGFEVAIDARGRVIDIAQR